MQYSSNVSLCFQPCPLYFFILLYLFCTFIRVLYIFFACLYFSLRVLGPTVLVAHMFDFLQLLVVLRLALVLLCAWKGTCFPDVLNISLAFSRLPLVFKSFLKFSAARARYELFRPCWKVGSMTLGLRRSVLCLGARRSSHVVTKCRAVKLIRGRPFPRAAGRS